MNHQVEVFEIAHDAKPDERPLVVDRFAVGAETLEEARRAALARLASSGRTVRSISFLAGGGFAAVVFAPAAASEVARKGRSAKGGPRGDS